MRIGASGQAVRYAEPLEIPADRATLALEFLHHLETGEPLHPLLDPDFNLGVMAALDAGLRSAESGQRQEVRTAPAG